MVLGLIFFIYSYSTNRKVFLFAGNLTYALSLVKKIVSKNPESEFAAIENAIESQMDEPNLRSGPAKETKPKSEVIFD